MTTYTQKEQINAIYIHDSIFTGFSYNYDKRQIYFTCEEKYYLEKRFHFWFNNTIFCNLQSCSFFGGGNSIMYICVEDNAPQMQELMDMQLQNSKLYEHSYLNKNISYIPISLLVNSGDTLLIICESVTYHEEGI